MFACILLSFLRWRALVFSCLVLTSALWIPLQFSLLPCLRFVSYLLFLYCCHVCSLLSCLRFDSLHFSSLLLMCLLFSCRLLLLLLVLSPRLFSSLLFFPILFFPILFFSLRCTFFKFSSCGCSSFLLLSWLHSSSLLFLPLSFLRQAVS